MNTKTKHVLRWVAVLPASILCSVIGYLMALLAGGTAMWLNGDSGGTFSITSIIMFVVSNVIAGYAFVYAGSLIAPSRKKVVAITLAVLHSLVGVSSAVLEVISNGFTNVLVGVIISFVAAIVACVQICKNDVGL